MDSTSIFLYYPGLVAETAFLFDHVAIMALLDSPHINTDSHNINIPIELGIDLGFIFIEK
jgi:hypothetical protein